MGSENQRGAKTRSLKGLMKKKTRETKKKGGGKVRKTRWGALDSNPRDGDRVGIAQKNGRFRGKKSGRRGEGGRVQNNKNIK